MPNFHSLIICEPDGGDFRLVIHIPKNVSAKDLREPEEPDQPYEIIDPPAESD